MILHATCQEKHELLQLATRSETKWENGTSGLTCSLLSSFLASLTLPMLPAPMVLPRIHFPDCVGMVVRDLALTVGMAARGSTAAGGWAGEGPAFWATALAMAAAVVEGRRGENMRGSDSCADDEREKGTMTRS